MSNNFFRFKQFTIWQNTNAMRVNTDSCMLGASVTTINPQRILDIGTGTGILALMMAQRFSYSAIDAVEIIAESALEAGINFRNSPWSDRITVYPMSIQKFIATVNHPYDLIISNPPYFSNHLKSAGKNNTNIARHDVALSMEELRDVALSRLNTNGRFYIILPGKEVLKFDNLMSDINLRICDSLTIFSKPRKSVHKIIRGYSCAGESKSEQVLYIHRENGEYSIEFRKLLKDFYLAF